MKHLTLARNTFEDTLQFSGVSLPRPLAHLVDLVLIDTSANDNGNVHEDPVKLATSEALFRYLVSLPSYPVVAYVDTPAKTQVPTHHHGLDLQLAQAYNLSVVDMLEGDPGIAAALPALFGNNQTQPKDQPRGEEPNGQPIKGPLFDIFSGARGASHYNAPYNEWVAAVLYYSHFARLFVDDGFPSSAPATTTYGATKPTKNDSKLGRGPFFMNCGLRQKPMPPRQRHAARPELRPGEFGV